VTDEPTTRARHIEEVIRFAVPWSDPVIVAADPDGEIGDLEDRPIFRLPLEVDGDRDRSRRGTQAILELEALRAKGACFLLFPATELWRLDAFDGLRDHVEANCRVAVRTDDCVVFTLRWPADADFRNRGAPDGLPIPPPELIKLTIGVEDSAVFYEQGAVGAAWIGRLLEHHGRSVGSMEAILDFGCGCGRVIRHWNGLGSAVRVIGADYNPLLVDWCRRHLPFAAFVRTPVAAQVEMQDESVDCVYAISVFTHLDERLQMACLDELTRLLRPGGLLLLTFHGSTRLDRMTPEERAAYDRGQLVVRRGEQSGSNACATFHPVSYIQDAFLTSLELVDVVPGGAQDVDQDAALLRKPPRR
jgi:SAM-dependent methyltransferase